jgi:hypothetical protein
VRGRAGRLTLRADVHAQLDLLQPMTLTQRDGASTDGSGFAWAAGFTFTVQR